jgi:hypothetical protein
MTKQERTQLNSLSKLLFKSSSKWQTLVNKGKVSDMEEILEDGSVRKYKGIKYPTVEEVKVEMQKLWQDELDRQEKAKKEKALNEMVVEGEKLGLYDESEFSELEMEALKQKEMIATKAGV